MLQVWGATLYLSQHIQIFKPKALELEGSKQTKPFSNENDCKVRITSFSVERPCDEVNNGFRFVKFSCGQKIKTDGGSAVCKPIESWTEVARNQCRELCTHPSPIAPSCQPRPACLDAHTEAGPCKLSEPAGGWCNPTSTPESRVCIQVITPARNLKTRVCKQFSTPCDVPEGWGRVSSC